MLEKLAVMWKKFAAEEKRCMALTIVLGKDNEDLE